MPTLLLYLLQVNIGLVLFFGTYQLVLKQTTFYQLNRYFLVSGLLLSSLLPLIDLSSLFQEQQQFYQTVQSFTPYWQLPITEGPTEQSFDLWLIPIVFFWLGVGFMVIRFLLQMASLYTIHQHAALASYQGIQYRQVQANLAPFSFGRAIYFNPKQHPEKDWLPILQHENTHVREWHTLDILLMEITTLIHWFNPAVWLLRKSLKQNLEFLTDQQTLRAGIDRKQYQFSLLQTAGGSPLSFTSSFSYPSLKHRIMMMNKAPSAKVQKLRFLAALPLLLVVLFACQEIPSTGAELGDVLAQEKPAKNQTAQEQYEAFLKRNPAVKGLGWDQETLFVYLKSGETERYPSTPEGTSAAEKKYGSLPVPPPPPPPAPAAPLAPPPPPPPYRTDWPKDFLARNPSVKGFTSSENTFYVILKNGEVETFDHSPEGVAALEKKYGPLPAPPPPTRVKDKLPPPPPPTRTKKQEEMPADYSAFLKRNPQVEYMHVTHNEFIMRIKNGGEDIFPKTAAGLKAAENKYGKLPSATPAPPFATPPLQITPPKGK